jgi:8-oxo-dGTP diphosphatase
MVVGSDEPMLRSFIRSILESTVRKRAAIVCIIDERGRFLSVSRKDDRDKIGFPGGKVDPGETPYEAAKRELKEETGLDSCNMKLVHVGRDGEYETYAFTADVVGTIETNEEGALTWVTREQLLDPEISPFHEYNANLFNSLDRL